MIKKILNMVFFYTKNPNWIPFRIHEILVNFVYGRIGDFALSSLSQPLLNEFIFYFEKTSSIKFSSLPFGESSTELVLTKYDYENELKNEKKLDEIIDFLPANHGLFMALQQELRPFIRNFTKSPFCYVNTRAWKTKTNSESYGPNALHVDGFVPGHVKVMVYITPMSQEYGKLQLGAECISNHPPGVAVIFRNSDVIHSGIAGTKFERFSIELTIFRSFISQYQFHPGHLNGRHYKTIFLPYWKKLSAVYEKVVALANKNIVLFCNSRMSLRKLNVGSGRRAWLGWLCLDAIDFPTVTKTQLSPSVIFPVASNSLDLAYSSHNFEHLDDATVDRVLEELKRCLKVGGKFLLKLPDFDWYLAQYRLGNPAAMTDCGVETVSWSWAANGVQQSLENRAAFMFCGYWNNSYGDHFAGDVHNESSAYHGPPKLDSPKMKNILSGATIREISRNLNAAAGQDPKFKSFNHRNAWSKEDLVELLERHGFSVETSDKQIIKSSFANQIPDFMTMFDTSLYLLAKR